ncbi:MAG: rhomboid family intramembrane serine protease [Bdellovibrionaceae bacterium]|nr:rhomboid family intramembrane serine protease [Pseudobdellovibrionaceae bacterium]
MIVPFLAGLRDFAVAPLTWTLIFLNMGFYFITSDPRPAPTAKESFFEVRNLQRTGVYYRQYLGMKDLPEPHELVLWGGKAMRDPGFVTAVPEFPFRGDADEIKNWRAEVSKLRDQTGARAVTKFGLPRDPAVAVQKPLTWITYQFMHATPIHLLSNMVFLLLFGIAIERLAGSLTVLLVSLLGGIFGAYFSMKLDAPSALPMVGASAAVTALIAFYLVYEPRKNVRYYFFFSPFQGFYGEIYLSKWWILPLCLLPDLVNFVTEFIPSPAQLIGQTVATTAHVGGALFGAAVAIAHRRFIGEGEYDRSGPDLGPTENESLI